MVQAKGVQIYKRFKVEIGSTKITDGRVYDVITSLRQLVYLIQGIM
jgi:hypothetical protein